jgi:hypothetical protein
MQQEYQSSITVENWRAMLPKAFKITPEGEPIEDAEAA